MGWCKDLGELTERLDTIANKYKTNKYSVSKDALLSAMIGAGPKADTIQQAVAVHGSALDIDVLEDEMHQTWRLMYGRHVQMNESGFSGFA